MSLCAYRNSYGFRGQLYSSKRPVEFSWSSATLKILSEGSGFKTKPATAFQQESKASSVDASTAIEAGAYIPQSTYSKQKEEAKKSCKVAISTTGAEDIYLVDKSGSVQESPRKSLSSLFFKSKTQSSAQDGYENVSSKQPEGSILRRPKPYGDDVTEIAEKSPDFVCTVSSSDEEVDSGNEEIIHKSDIEKKGNVAMILDKFSRQNFTAGDGNPVRHSLINLVMEEDVPLLMEAMAEKLHFEFEDVDAIPSSSSEGIIRNPGSAQRKKQRNASKIGFSNSPPTVFSYPDENTATEFSEWHPGEDITFEEYQRICEEERQKYEEERTEASKWQPAFNANEIGSIISVSEQPTVDDFALGVTSRISYSASPPYSSNNNNIGTNSISLIAGK